MGVWSGLAVAWLVQHKGAEYAVTYSITVNASVPWGATCLVHGPWDGIFLFEPKATPAVLKGHLWRGLKDHRGSRDGALVGHVQGKIPSPLCYGSSPREVAPTNFPQTLGLRH